MRVEPKVGEEALDREGRSEPALRRTSVGEGRGRAPGEGPLASGGWEFKCREGEGSKGKEREG